MKNIIVQAIYWMAFLLVVPAGFATDLDDLGALSDNPPAQVTESGELEKLDNLSGDDLGLSELSDDRSLTDADTMEDPSSDLPEDDSQKLTLSFSGYGKMMGYGTRNEYSDSMMSMYNNIRNNSFSSNTPQKEKKSDFSHIGVRMQFKLEGYLGDVGRVFAAINLDHNEMADEDANEKVDDIRFVESFFEYYQGNRTWKIGNQLITWGFMEGIEVPTDRVNARDSQYASMEFEDTKIASTAILMRQTFSDFNYLDLIYIPKAKVNIDPDYADVLYTADDQMSDDYEQNSKYAVRFVFNLGKLDAALSYVEGMDTTKDVTVQDDGQYQRSYNRVQSSGLDLQYNFGSLLWKLAATYNKTEDDAGDDPFIKNNWSKYLTGAEFSAFSSTINFYAGQMRVENFHQETADKSYITNGLMGQDREVTNFVSGNISANFLTGDALGVSINFANYWDDLYNTVQRYVSGQFTYKLSDGLEVAVSPQYLKSGESRFYTLKSEMTYHF